MEMKPVQLRMVGLFAVGLGLFICYVTLRTGLFN